MKKFSVFLSFVMAFFLTLGMFTPLSFAESVKGISCNLGSPYYTLIENPAGKYVATTDLNPTGNIQYKKVTYEFTFGPNPTGWLVNIGDSNTNNGYGGDSGTQSNDSELQIENGTLSIYLNDDGVASGLPSLLVSEPNCAPANGKIKLEISNNKVYYYNYTTGVSRTWTSPYIFALNGQSDSEGSINYKLYTGINRVVGNTSRVGSDVTNATITFSEAIKSHVISWVQDNLNSYDGVILGDGLISRGYNEIARNTNVTASSLNNYFTQGDLNFVYHTGHGNVGSIACSGGSLTVNTVGTLNARNIVVATCLTMADRAWMNKFGSTEHLMGYTNYSYDIVDNQVCNDMLTGLDSGKNWSRIWYESNINKSQLYDRWLVYKKQNGVVTEYSANNSNIPSLMGENYTLYHGEYGDVNISEKILSENKDFASEFSNFYNIVINNDHIANSSEFLGDNDEFLSNTEMNKEEAIKIAKKWIKENNVLPSEAVLESVNPIKAYTQDNGEKIIGYEIRYARVISKLKVRTNGIAEYISVLVNNGKVIHHGMNWSNIKIEKPSDKMNLVPVSEAVKTATEHILSILKGGNVNFENVNPCYTLCNGNLTPAYELVADDGGYIVINALTGEIAE